jgi:hypothetical protein
MPDLARRIVDTEALATVSAACVVALMKNTGANVTLDTVYTCEPSVGCMNVSIPDPEVKCSMLGGAAWRWRGLTRRLG